MAERNVTVVTSTLEIGGKPMNEFVAARGLFPLLLSPAQRFPFYDSVFDLVHAINALDEASRTEALEFFMFDNRSGSQGRRLVLARQLPLRRRRQKAHGHKAARETRVQETEMGGGREGRRELIGEDTDTSLGRDAEASEKLNCVVFAGEQVMGRFFRFMPTQFVGRSFHRTGLVVCCIQNKRNMGLIMSVKSLITFIRKVMQRKKQLFYAYRSKSALHCLRFSLCINHWLIID
ncbi:hypothetical protein MUK42_37498 [Musa troglodytarum]|uniref:Uncharacterized protein n=1 Tax=Musa troglodytarum TaxID=320322 RepID=A0A9E7EGK7_9LILI|nr:hypothetical protein MUK42_37498 [Musa troglodytarum]